MDREKLAIYYVRLRDKTLSLSLMPVVTAVMSKGVIVNKIIYGEPKSKLNGSELYIDKAAKKPVFIYVHGGGWVQGTHIIRNPYCSRIADLGFYVLNINYELAPDAKHPVQVRNIFSAISYVFERKDEYNLDTDNIFLGGDSAGGHLAALAVSVTVNKRLYDEFCIKFDHKDDFKVKGFVSVCGIFDFLSCRYADFHNLELYARSYSGYDVREIDDVETLFERQDIKDMCPASLVNPDFPPCVLLTGEKDPLKPATDLFYEVLKKNNVKTRLYVGKGKYSVHAYPLFDGNTNGKRAMREVYAFFHEVLGDGYGLLNPKAAPVDSDLIQRGVTSDIESDIVYDMGGDAENGETDENSEDKKEKRGFEIIVGGRTYIVAEETKLLVEDLINSRS
ncbi:MAG: alpha/beta hydrolase [Clostridiales bacterium]|jgi:acetyl esterase/lipase|nr:alpha/beta hydrolase [Clostridiales bacterium]